MRTALVVDRDESFRLMVTEALSVFSPGFHVGSAPDLAGAEGRPEAGRSPLLVVGSDAAPMSEIEGWAARHGAGVVVVPRGQVDAVAVPHGFRVAGSDRLSDVLLAVRDFASQLPPRVLSEAVS